MRDPVHAGLTTEPLGRSTAHIELYLRWLQEVRRIKPSTVSRRMSVVAGFYRTCVIDDVLHTHQPSTFDDLTSRRSRPPSG
jgi:integrase/recombinase XerD